MIPAEAVEAAGEALYAALASRGLDDRVDGCGKVAIAILEAAAPHMLGCDDALWHEFQAATQQAGTNPSVVIRGLVREWVDAREVEESS